MSISVSLQIFPTHTLDFAQCLLLTLITPHRGHSSQGSLLTGITPHRLRGAGDSAYVRPDLSAELSSLQLFPGLSEMLLKIVIHHQLTVTGVAIVHFSSFLPLYLTKPKGIFQINSDFLLCSFNLVVANYHSFWWTFLLLVRMNSLWGKMD